MCDKGKVILEYKVFFKKKQHIFYKHKVVLNIFIKKANKFCNIKQCSIYSEV